MADGNSLDNLIDDSQGAMGEMDDFTSFEEANASVPEGMIDESAASEDDTKESLSFDEMAALEDRDEEIKEKPKEEEPAPKEDKEQVKDEEEEEGKPEVKSFSFKDGEKEVNIPRNSTVKIPVDGKEVEMSLQDVINKASGEVAVDRRFSELAKEKNQFKVERNQYEVDKNDLTSKVGSFVEAVDRQDAMGAVHSLATLTGHNPIQLAQHFRNLMINEVRKYDAMSPEEKIAFDNKQNSDYHKQINESLQSQNEIQQANMELTNSILRFQAKHGIDDAALVALYDEAEAKSIAIESAEDLERYHSEKLSLDRSSELISQVDPSLSEDEESLEIVKEFITKNPDLSDDDVIQAIKHAMGKEEDQEAKQEKSLSDKIQDKQKKNQKGKKAAKPEESFEDDEEEIVLFDDIGY